MTETGTEYLTLENGAVERGETSRLVTVGPVVVMDGDGGVFFFGPSVYFGGGLVGQLSPHFVSISQPFH